MASVELATFERIYSRIMEHLWTMKHIKPGKKQLLHSPPCFIFRLNIFLYYIVNLYFKHGDTQINVIVINFWHVVKSTNPTNPNLTCGHFLFRTWLPFQEYKPCYSVFHSLDFNFNEMQKKSSYVNQYLHV